ncbi:MAG: hypothetical protein LC754_14200 [Acidobacteria bacterium]|nr:hypothetical protein [Acidobacteriota bacterium]
MSAILIISIFLLVLTSFVVYRSKRSSSSQEEAQEFVPGHARSLFSEPGTGSQDKHEGDADFQVNTLEDRAVALRARAAAGDLEALSDAHLMGDASLYREILDTLTEQSTDAPEILRALCSRIARGEDLRASPSLTEKLLENWKLSPSRASTIELLRVAALSDDAGMFERAIVTVFDFRQAGRLQGLAASELRALFESEYWLLSAEAKRSGAGFMLRQKLAELRRRLGTDEQREEILSTEPGGHPSASH